VLSGRKRIDPTPFPCGRMYRLFHYRLETTWAHILLGIITPELEGQKSKNLAHKYISGGFGSQTRPPSPPGFFFRPYVVLMSPLYCNPINAISEWLFKYTGALWGKSLWCTPTAVPVILGRPMLQWGSGPHHTSPAPSRALFKHLQMEMFFCCSAWQLLRHIMTDKSLRYRCCKCWHNV
jgi:hypothetical protein